MKFLVFHLHGPLASWGDIAVGEVRPSFPAPTRSALLGLLAAAKGIKRDEQSRLTTLSEQLSFAVRVDHSGSFVEEYQTISLPEGAGHKAARTRRIELWFSRKNTLQTYRGHYTDAAYTVFVSSTNQKLLTTLQQALRTPVFVPYLGRKACPLDIPMLPRVITSSGLDEALVSSEAEFPAEILELFKGTNVSPKRRHGVPRRVIADESFDTWKPLSTEERNNEPGNRARWSFSPNRVSIGFDIQLSSQEA